MLTVLCFICLIGIFGKLVEVAFRMAWGITKVIFTLVFLPLIIIGLIIGGLLYLAIPILVVVGFVTIIQAVFD